MKSLLNTINKVAPSDSLKEDFEKMKNAPVVRMRKVYLRLRLSCGCGGDDNRDIKVEREVPYDSKIKDGDHISLSNIQEDDRRAGVW